MKISKKRGLIVFALICAIALTFVGCNKPKEDDGEKPAEKTVSSVEISQSEASILLGNKIALSAKVKYSDGSEDNDVIWKTSAEAVATVNNGEVTGVAVGNAVITAAAVKNESVSASCTVSVIKEAELSLNASETTLIMGKGDAKISAVVKRSNGSVDSNVDWVSSAENIVKVTDDGTISPVAAGNAEITASTTDNGKTLSAICKVHVVADASSLTNGVAEGLSYTIKNTDSNADLGYSVKAENKEITKANILDAYNGVRVTEIEEEAFRQCIKLEEFSFGKSVVRIGAHAFTMEKEYELQVNGSSEVLIEHDRKAEVSARLRVNLDLNPGTVLDEYALADSFFKVITLPEGMTEIPAYAFTGSTVTEVVFPTTLTSIKGYAFAGCINLTSADLTYTKVTEIGSAGSDAFGIGNSFFQCGVLKKVGTLPSTLKTIEPYSFSVCTNLKEIALNDGLEKIGAQAFMQCASIASMDIPASVTVVGANAFGRWGSDQAISVAFAQGSEPEGWSAAWAGDNCRAVISYK